MEAATRRGARRRITLSVNGDLYDRLAAQAARGQASIEDLVTRWLEEKVAESETRADGGRVDPEWRRRMESLVAEFRSSVPADMSPEELKAEIAAARDEVRAARRARRC
jgi:hypothetical protein